MLSHTRQSAQSPPASSTSSKPKTCTIYLDCASRIARCEYAGASVQHPRITRDNVHTLIYHFQQRGFFVTLYEVSRPQFFPGFLEKG